MKYEVLVVDGIVVYSEYSVIHENGFCSFLENKDVKMTTFTTVIMLLLFTRLQCRSFVRVCRKTNREYV